MSRNADASAVWVLLGMGLVFSLVGDGIVVWQINLAQRAIASESWPTTPGKILDSKIVRHVDDEDADTFSPSILYEYYVDGDTLQGNQITIAETISTSNPNNGRDLIRQYPVGKDVEIYVDPENGEKSVLIPGFGPSKTGLLFLGGFGAIFGLVGLGLLIGGLRTWWSSRLGGTGSAVR